MYKVAEKHKKVSILADAMEELTATLNGLAELTEDERDDVIWAVHGYIFQECPASIEEIMGTFLREWSLKMVVEYECRGEIQDHITKIVGPGVKRNSPESFKHYQTVVSAIMNKLSNMEHKVYSAKAQKWNELGALPIVKSKTPEGNVEVFVTKTDSNIPFSKMFPKFLSENCKLFCDYCNITINSNLNLIPAGAEGRNKKCPKDLQLQYEVAYKSGKVGSCDARLFECTMATGVEGDKVPWSLVSKNPKAYIDKHFLPNSGILCDPSHLHVANMQQLLRRIQDGPEDDFDFKIERRFGHEGKQKRGTNKGKKTARKGEASIPFSDQDDASVSDGSSNEEEARRTNASDKEDGPQHQSHPQVTTGMGKGKAKGPANGPATSPVSSGRLDSNENVPGPSNRCHISKKQMLVRSRHPRKRAGSHGTGNDTDWSPVCVQTVKKKVYIQSESEDDGQDTPWDMGWNRSITPERATGGTDIEESDPENEGAPLLNTIRKMQDDAVRQSKKDLHRDMQTKRRNQYLTQFGDASEIPKTPHNGTSNTSIGWSTTLTWGTAQKRRRADIGMDTNANADPDPMSYPNSDSVPNSDGS
ncbi:hypothetical protein JAAARDRAFT_187395 [Jaapia argillacea MUCL 33604]|uniref:Uncharacterized protein n=1 Tax=Jaapia argillacea MUCL 33604 TaxID=933084 RepID=A0A067QCY0_9AGAM|nr:hypothetical protein JAAARDRAFT_187395 [Jaapia argillacea MUCL 33604]